MDLPRLQWNVRFAAPMAVFAVHKHTPPTRALIYVAVPADYTAPLKLGRLCADI